MRKPIDDEVPKWRDIISKAAARSNADQYCATGATSSLAVPVLIVLR
jgi:hypothetical protein